MKGGLQAKVAYNNNKVDSLIGDSGTTDYFIINKNYLSSWYDLEIPKLISCANKEEIADLKATSVGDISVKSFGEKYSLKKRYYMYQICVKIYYHLVRWSMKVICCVEEKFCMCISRSRPHTCVKWCKEKWFLVFSFRLRSKSVCFSNKWS